MDGEEDANEFLETTFTDACKSLNFSKEPSENNVFHRYRRGTQSLLVHATTLGSVLVVTSTIEPGNTIRTLQLSSAEVNNVSFVKTHLVAWLVHGGQYETASSPHLQGLSTEMVKRISSYLDSQSSTNMKRTNKAISKAVPFSNRSSHSKATKLSSTPRFTWREEDIA
jgi:hypothetical protein